MPLEVQGRAGGQDEVDPPHAEGQGRAAEAHQRRIDAPAVVGHDGAEGFDRTDQAFAQGDDGQQPVALGDMVRVPRGPHGLALRGVGRGHFQDEQGRSHKERGQDVRLNDEHRDPAELHHAKVRGVAPAGLPAGGILPRRAQPLEHQGQAHDHVAAHHHGVVHMVALHERVEHGLDSHGQDQDAEELDHGDHPEHPVVGVVGAGEPREVDPGPDHREHREGESQQPGAEVGFGDLMGELAAGHAEGNDKGQVEEEFQRRGGTVLFMRIPAAHAGHGVPEGIGGHGSKSTAGAQRLQRRPLVRGGGTRNAEATRARRSGRCRRGQKCCRARRRRGSGGELPNQPNTIVGASVPIHLATAMTSDWPRPPPRADEHGDEQPGHQQVLQEGGVARCGLPAELRDEQQLHGEGGGAQEDGPADEELPRHPGGELGPAEPEERVQDDDVRQRPHDVDDALDGQCGGGRARGIDGLPGEVQREGRGGDRIAPVPEADPDCVGVHHRPGNAADNSQEQDHRTRTRDYTRPRASMSSRNSSWTSLLTVVRVSPMASR